MNDYEKLRLQSERMAQLAAEQRFIIDQQRRRSNRVWLMIIILSGIICLGGQHLVFKYEQGAHAGEITLKSELTPTQTNSLR